MKTVGFFAGLISLFAANASSAQEAWFVLPNQDPNITFAIDKRSIVRRGELVSVWEKLIYTQAQLKDEASGKPIKEKRVHRLMHCTDATQGVISGATYTEHGRFISSVTYDAGQIEMMPIPPGTLAAEELQLLCLLTPVP